MTYRVYVQWAPPEICQRSECASKQENKYGGYGRWASLEIYQRSECASKQESKV